MQRQWNTKTAQPVVVIVALMVGLCVGCSNRPSDTPELGTVTGTVIIDGKPTSAVVVRFAPKDGGRPSTGATDENGQYTLTYSTSAMGAKAGVHTVSIASNVAIDPENYQATLPKGNVPDKYAEIQKEVTVKPGKNVIDLNYP